MLTWAGAVCVCVCGAQDVLVLADDKAVSSFFDDGARHLRSRGQPRCPTTPRVGQMPYTMFC